MNQYPAKEFWEEISPLKKRLRQSPAFYRAAFFFTILAAALAVPLAAAPSPSAFHLLDAREKGTTNAGAAKSGIIATYDETANKDVLEFDYALEPGSQVRVWARNFTARINASQVNTAKIAVKVPDAAQAAQISMSVEIQGTQGTQTVSLDLKSGWNTVQKTIDWNTIGDLTEIDFVTAPAGDTELVKGTLYLAVDFVEKKAAPSPKSVSSPINKEAAGAGFKPAPASVKATTPPSPARSSFTLLDAREKGVSSTGSAKGSVMPTFDEVAEKDILEFDYSLPPGSSVSVWARNFPDGLESTAVNTAKWGIRVLNAGAENQISLTLQIQGSEEIQSIPVSLKAGWNSALAPIDWEAIGGFKAASFHVTSLSRSEPVKGTLNLALDFIKSASLKPAAPSQDAFSSFNLLDSGEKGVFNIGASKGAIRSTFDEELGKDVWAFDYSVPLGSVVGIWTKDYPGELGPQRADAVRVRVKALHPNQLDQVAVKVEIKGENTLQTLPLGLQTGWTSTREPIHWNKIGELKEAVFVVSPTANSLAEESAPIRIGTLYFDLDFGKLTFLEKNAVFLKVVWVIVFSLLLAWMSSWIGAFPAQGPFGAWLKAAGDERSSDPASHTVALWSKLKPDLYYGAVAVLIGGVALRIYSMGAVNPLDEKFGFGFLAAAFAGAVIAELLKFKLTGKHLTRLEVFQNVLLTGLLAASSSSEELWQAPAGWVQLITLNKLSAAVTFLVYQIFNAYSLASSGKHLKPFTGAALAGTPYLFGWLLLLENAALLKALANAVTLGIFSAWPGFREILGRVLVLFVFNEAVANGIGWLTQGKILKTPKARLWILGVSAGAVMAPWIADLGSTEAAAALPVLVRALTAILTTSLAFGGLWGEVYLITGILLDAGRRTAPSAETLTKHVTTGSKKGLAYSGILMAILYALHMLLDNGVSRQLMSAFPLGAGILAGAALFPFLKTIIETFDGSLPFFERTRYSYRQKTLYARGAVAGFGFASMITQGMFERAMPERMAFGLFIGVLASGGVSFLRDAVYAFRGQGRIQSWRLYLIDSLLGIFVGGAAAFYLDAAQVPVIVEKFKLYIGAGLPKADYITYPLVNKWGRMDLGTYTGGVKLIFQESLAGVINWSIAAWLFAINKVFLQAFFEKDKTPIKFFFSKAGLAQLIEHMIYVLRWGLWMSPIIFTFLRMMPNPTWYNQDGAIRTLAAIYQNLTLPPEAFQAWSLKIFIYVMAFDLFRILIWMDHMGLRVATLVNLSFIGMDKLDERVARFIGPAAAQRYIPEGVKRFTTWAPLLIPFYIPRGEAWDHAWSTAEALQNAGRGKGLVSTLESLPLIETILVAAGAILVCAGISYAVRRLRARTRRRSLASYELANREYKVTVRENGEAYSELLQKECDISRRSYDLIDPSGRILYFLDVPPGSHGKTRFWPVLGNFPQDKFQPSRIERIDDTLRVVNITHGVTATVEISLPDPDSPAEIWKITVENLTDKPRRLKMVPYLEWVLNGGLHDRFHTQYARLYPEMEYAAEANAVLSWQKSTKSMGILASDAVPEGFLTSRVDFIGRARSVWAPRIFETLDFHAARDTAPYPTFDPIGSLLVNTALGPRASKTVRLMIGYAKNRKSALKLIHQHLKPQVSHAAPHAEKKKRPLLIGHGEIPPGTPQPYCEFLDDGKKLLVHTPFTPRPFDHAMSNALGHSVMVTNRGLHTSSNGNSQQNRLTPDWPDTVTKEIPSEAIYLYDPEKNEWFSPTYHPLNQQDAKYESEFGVDGTAVFRMSHGALSTELTVFVPPGDPAGVYLLTLKNNSDHPRQMRVAPYFHMVLAFQPERSGPLVHHHDKALNALFFENPRNIFRSGWAFASMSLPSECVETKRGRFFGTGRGVDRPYLVEKGEPDSREGTDEGQIAGFLGTVEIPAHGECAVAVILGQSDQRDQAVQVVQKYKNIETVRKSLDETRAWWLNLMGTVTVETNHPEFDRFLDWLKYQALAERIWARRGFYQTSGAYGYRDQLQDSVNLIWVDPALARKQILLHASHQFIEGDVFHWFFTLTDGRTAFSCRSHASDNPVWLAWAVAEYLKATGDDSILDEMASYVASEFPFAPLPKNKQGWGHLYHRSTRADTVYRHCLKSIDLVLDQRMGAHGLPLIQTGDWNDGLDEIGSEGKGESVWLGFFLYTILRDMLPVIEKKEGPARKEHYFGKMKALGADLERTWRADRYLRAIHDDGTEIGVKDSGVWEIDALTASWAVMSGINFERGLTVFNTALEVLEKENAVLLGWPALREDTKPYLGRSSKYPEGVRENGMYCHGVQWLVKAARILAEQFEKQGDPAKASEYRGTAYRLWFKISPLAHTTAQEIEIYGGQPNKQAADLLTNFEPGRMIWHGYTGAAGWMLRQALEGVVGLALVQNQLLFPEDLNQPRGPLKVIRVSRHVEKSPLGSNGTFYGSREEALPQKPRSKVEIAAPEVPVEVQ